MNSNRKQVFWRIRNRQFVGAKGRIETVTRITFAGILGRLLISLIWFTIGTHAAPLTTLEYKIVSTQLRVDPPSISVPKGVPGSVNVDVVSGDGVKNSQGIVGAHVEALLRGPSFPARRLVGRANEALLLPPLYLVGDYQLDDIKLVDSTTGAVRMEAVPNSVPVRVFDEVLVSRVTSRPLSLDEIKEKGIFIDEQNFRAVEFEVVFTLRGGQFVVKMPVVAPSFSQSTEIIPRAELEERLAEAARINAQIGEQIKLPPELETAGLNIALAPINFEPAGGGDGEDQQKRLPPITGLLVIPGNIGFLNQFFSVQIYTENVAPRDSRLSVSNVRAELVLPPGSDRVPASSYDAPGDDPLRFARVGPEKVIQSIQPVTQTGPDGRSGTSDDILRLQPGDTGQGEFLVEGLKEGLHVMDVKLTADLEGLAAGVVRISGKAAGAILVRNPRFSMSFAHPRVVRFDEPYEASVTLLNTSETVANLVRVSLRRTSLSGLVLEADQDETVELGNLAPGESATATYRMRSLRTGYVSMSNLTTSDDSVSGRFNLTAGVDERGVALSPDSIGYPDWVSNLPTNLVRKTQRILGQALCVATAGQLPPNVKPVSRSTVTTRVLELAEAGQRIRYGDDTNRVLVDLMLDWQGGREFSDGFDQILRETAAGVEFRDGLMSDLELSDQRTGLERISNRAADLAGRGESWLLASASHAALEVSMSARDAIAGVAGSSPRLTANTDASQIPQAAGYRGARGDWLAVPQASDAVFEWRASQNVVEGSIGVLVVSNNGRAEELRWNLASSSAGAIYRYAMAAGAGLLDVDTNGDGQIDQTLVAARTAVSERAPEVVRVIQDITVKLARPQPPCPLEQYRNYGSVMAVLFSKPMRQEDVGRPESYVLDDGNPATSVQIQPGGRVALVNLKFSIGKFRERSLYFQNISDARTNELATVSKPIVTTADQGISLKGRVIGLGGSPVAGVPVTLIRHDEIASSIGCVGVVVRESQTFTDADGNFDFDFILAAAGYEIAVTDTSALTEGTSREIIQSLLDAGTGSQLKRDQLTDLLNQAEVGAAMLRAFNAGTIDQAVASVEGLDRATFRDLVSANSARIGTEVPVVLRFRGRGTVIGRALAADGVTPLAGAAVNLFPDADSRELGRGMFADDQGRFAFYGVPLGVYSVTVKTSDNRQRAISGFLDTVGKTNRHDIIAGDATVTQFTAVKGRVFERDGVTPHGNAQVYIGDLTASPRLAVAVTSADAQGFWEAPNVPVGFWDVAAVSSDGRRKAERARLSIQEVSVNYVVLQLQGLTTVSGQVVFDNGTPAVNAQVAGGEMIVRTDAAGHFTLTGVPTGLRQVNAGLERNDDLGILVTRLGGAEIEVLPGIDNRVIIKLEPRGRLTGRVFDAAGNAVPNVRVAIPQKEGFLWVRANESGRYNFDSMGLGDYLLSAPSPPVREDPEAISARAIEAIRSGSKDEILAAVKDAFTAFVNAPESRLVSDPFSPDSWGYTRTGLLYDGHVVNADIFFQTAGTVGGTTMNSQDVPVGAEVVLWGIGPSGTGAPRELIRAGGVSDPATGIFLFPNSALPGPIRLVAESPFFPIRAEAAGVAAPASGGSTNYVLRFAPAHETSGRLTGFVFNPDGTTAGAGMSVHINLSSDYIITTDTNGFFDTQLKIPAEDYTVTVTNTANGLVGIAGAKVIPGITNRTSVTLLDRGDLTVEITLANGSPATNAEVKIKQFGFPSEEFEDGRTDGSGRLILRDIFEGTYSIEARLVVGVSSVAGRTEVEVLPRTNVLAGLMLGGSGAVRGVFVGNDRLTPVPFAQVAAEGAGFATTDANGRFEFLGMPLGRRVFQAKNSLTGRLAFGEAELRTDGEISQLILVERDLGEVQGLVFGGDATSVVVGAEVTLTTKSGIDPARTVTTGPDGGFRFPGTPAGDFRLWAQDRALMTQQFIDATLPGGIASFRVDLNMPAFASLPGMVVRPDGRTPAANVNISVRVGEITLSADTDEQGRFLLRNLPLGEHELEIRSLITSETRSYARARVTLTTVGTATPITNVLTGVGVVSGVVFRSDGTTPASGAELRLSFPPDETGTLSSIFVNDSATTFADNNGAYRFGNVPIGAFDVRAAQLALVSYVRSTNRFDGQAHVVNLSLSPSGSVRGRLVRADGSDPRTPLDLVATFASLTSFAGRSTARTDTTGTFEMLNIPVGSFTLGAVVPVFNGILLRSLAITSNGQVLNLGDVRLDEDDPSVVDVFPPNGATEVPINTVIELTFNEELAETSATTNGIVLRSPTNSVSAVLELLPHPAGGGARLARLTPSEPLRSQTTYEIIVLSGERQNALGDLIKAGPTDLVGRPLRATFVSEFATKDNDPPFLTSFTPATNAIQIDPRAVIRLEYNEPLRNRGFSIMVRGPGGTVAGRTAVGPNLRLLTFTPDAALLPNTAYTVTVTNVQDLAGNNALDHPFSYRFNTLDTLGPEIATVRFANNTSPVAGATLQLESVLATVEPGAEVRYTADVNASGIKGLGTVTTPPYRVSITLPASGQVVFRATAIDRFGNEGPLKEFIATVVPNQPPTIVLERDVPATGGLRSGQPFSLHVEGADDAGVANISLVSAGVFLLNTNITVGGIVVLRVPPETLTGAIQFRAQSTDTLGAKSPVATLDLQVFDGTLPTLAIVSPTNNAVLDLSRPLDIPVIVSDNSTNVQLSIEFSGALTLTQRVTVVLAPNIPVTNTFTASLAGVSQTGDSITATVRAIDNATNATSLVRVFRLPDITAPRLVSVIPENSATNQSLWLLGTTFVFSEPIAAATVTTNRLLLTNSTGVALPYRLTLTSDDLAVLLSPEDSPLQPGVTYTARLLSGLRDTSGNSLVDSAGVPIPPQGIAFTFTTAKFLQVVPTNNARVVAGQILPVTVNFERGLGASYFRFTLDNEAPVDVFVSADAESATGLLAIPEGPAQVRVSIQASDFNFFSNPYSLPVLTFTVRPRGADDDGDGLPNGYEANYGLDPFANDASQDPDGDRLPNLQEFSIGTDPRNPDTDGDGLSDGFEFLAGNCLNPLNPDSDGDGLPDGVDPSPCGEAETGVTFVVTTSVTLTEGERITLMIQASSVIAALVVLDFGPTNPPPLFASLGIAQFTNTATSGNAVAELSLDPTHLDAGTYTITIRATAANNTTGRTNITVTVLDNPAIRTTRWQQAVSGNWADPARWSAGLPDATKVAVIDLNGTYAVTVDADVTAAGLTMNGSTGGQTLLLNGNTLTLEGASSVRGSGVFDFRGGVLAGTGSLTIGSRIDWSGGTMDGDGQTIVGPAGQFNLGGDQFKFLYRRLDNGGTNDWSGTGDLWFVDGQINNLAGAVFHAQGGAQMRVQGGTDNAFNNAGTFVKTGASATIFSGVAFNNSGTVHVTQGGLSLNGGGTNTGTMRVSGGTALDLAGNHEFSGGSVVTGDGAVNINGATVDVSGTVNVTGGLYIDFGTVNFNEDQSLRRLRLSGGTLGGTGNVSVMEVLDWSGGTMDGDGRTIVGPAGQFNLGGDQFKFLYRRLDNGGTNDWSGTGDLWFVDGQINNLAGAVFHAQGGAQMRVQGGTDNAFNNAGTFLKTGASATIFSGVAFNNSGTVHVTQGGLSLNGGGTNSAVMVVESNASLVISGAMYSLWPGAIFNGAGTLEVISGAHLALETDVNFGAINVGFRDSSTIGGNHRISNAPGGAAIFDTSTTVPGSMEIAGALILTEPNAVLQINGTLTLAASGTINNPATLRVGAFLNNGGILIGNAPVLIGGNLLHTVRISRIELIDGTDRLFDPFVDSKASPDAIISWVGEPRRPFSIQVSHDLRNWTSHEATIVEIEAGSYQAFVTVLLGQPNYFRLQW